MVEEKKQQTYRLFSFFECGRREWDDPSRVEAGRGRLSDANSSLVTGSSIEISAFANCRRTVIDFDRVMRQDGEPEVDLRGRAGTVWGTGAASVGVSCSRRCGANGAGKGPAGRVFCPEEDGLPRTKLESKTEGLGYILEKGFTWVRGPNEERMAETNRVRGSTGRVNNLAEDTRYAIPGARPLIIESTITKLT